MRQTGTPMTDSPIQRRPGTPQVEYRFVHLAQDSTTGEWVDGATGLGHRQLIKEAAAAGWKFVQALPTGLDGKGLDLVLERNLVFRPLVIGHVPKTAGTSVTGVISEYMRQVIGLPVASILHYGHMVPYTDLRPLRQLPPFVRLVAGHFGRDHYQLLLRSDPFVLVSLRDPFDRFLSTLEHEYRDAVACPESADDAARERYARIMAVIERLSVARHDAAAITGALQAFKHDHIPAAEYLMYTNRPVAHAWIDSGEIGRLCEMLAATAPNPAATRQHLEAHSRLNIFPHQLFPEHDAADRGRLRECFQDVFREEVDLDERIRGDTPSLFSGDAWATLLECLWRTQIPATQT